MLLAGAGRVIPQLIGARDRRVVAALRRAGSRTGPRSLALLSRHGRAHGLILLHLRRRLISLRRLLIQDLGSTRCLLLVLVALLVQALLRVLPHLRILGLLHLHLRLLGHVSLLLDSLHLFIRMPHAVHVLELLVEILDLPMVQAESLPVDQAANSVELVHK